jgi:hypothetical protein
MLREEMELLDWVSLRRIGYSTHFDELWAGSMEVVDDVPGGASDSDDEDEFPAHLSAEGDDNDTEEGEDSADDDDDEDDGGG